jgi:iron complex outermembrane receptor protein
MPIASTTLDLRQSAKLAAASLQWSPTTAQIVFTRLTQTAEPPTFDDLLFVSGTYPNLSRRSQVLQCQRATTFELSTRGQYGPIECDISAYRSEWRNEILRLADARGQPRGAVNAGPTLHTGIESSVRWKIYDQSQRITLSAQSVLNRFTFDDDPVFGYNRLAGVPPYSGSADLLYENPGGLFAGCGLNWTAGRTLIDHAGRMAYGGHALTNLRVGWRHSKVWSLYAEVRNIFDRRTIASTAGVLDVARNPTATSVFLPGNGRAFAVGFEWRK